MRSSGAPRALLPFPKRRLLSAELDHRTGCVLRRNFAGSESRKALTTERTELPRGKIATGRRFLAKTHGQTHNSALPYDGRPTSSGEKDCSPVLRRWL